MVIFGHLQSATHFTRSWADLAGLHGVLIFFVLSGFLITTNLTKGNFDLKRFYIRRFFRLMPVVWIYLAFFVTVGQITKVHLVSWVEIKPCLLFYRNYVGPNPGGAMTGHFWTLSLEEQFYLVWPWLLLLLGARGCRWFAALGALAVAILQWRMGHYYEIGLRSQRTEFRADSLLLGCLLALLLSDSAFRKRAIQLTKWLAFPAGAGLVLSVLRFPATIFESVCIAVLIAAAMLHPSHLPSRIFSCKPLAWLGTVSYSVYVWQEPFMWFKGSGLGFSFLLIFFMPLFAMGSYYLIERPCTQFGRNLTSATDAKVIASDPAPELSLP